MSDAVHFQPEGYHTLTPYFAVDNAAEAIEFYRQAFGAEERMRMPGPNGSVVHAELQIGDSVLMMGDENPDQGAPSPKTLGGSPAGVMIYVEDVDATFERAVAAGAEVEAPPMDMFWGDRFGKLVDPFGHKWSLATHIEAVDKEEMAVRAAAFAAEMAGG